MRTLIILIAASLLMSGSAWAEGKKIQCWTDDKGHRACGDYVPPQYAKKEVNILNKQGMVIEKKQREKTAAEAAEDERKAQALIDAQNQARTRAAYDRFLLDTYSNVKELEKARDIRVQTLDSRISLAEKAVKDGEAALTDLRGRKPSKVPEGADPKRAAAVAKTNEKLAKQLAAFEKSLADNTLAISTMKKEREQTVSKFAEDIQRWQDLKSPTAVKP